tara:strand:+ start:2843 stop:3244 length:402 start_codon:yes stop_codon:yes gene_type:complete
MTSFIAKSLLVILGSFLIVSGLIVIFSPNINSMFIPFDVDSNAIALAAMIRTYAGFFTACGYLTIRFVYSSSKVQIGSILLYILGMMIIARIFSLMFDGVTDYALITLTIGALLFLSLFVVQKNRKNQISYDL